MNPHKDHAIEHEIIGAMLTSKQAYLDVFDVITSEDFEVTYLAKCFNLISDAFRDEKDVSLPELVKQTGAPAAKLVESMDNGDLSALFAKNKAKRIRELANKRRVYTGCRELLLQIETMEPVEISTMLSEIAAMVSMSGDVSCLFYYLFLFIKLCHFTAAFLFLILVLPPRLPVSLVNTLLLGNGGIGFTGSKS